MRLNQFSGNLASIEVLDMPREAPGPIERSMDEWKVMQMSVYAGVAALNVI